MRSVGGALAGPRYYNDGPYYAAAPYPYGCTVQRERYWDGYRWRIHRVRVC